MSTQDTSRKLDDYNESLIEKYHLERKFWRDKYNPRFDRSWNVFKIIRPLTLRRLALLVWSFSVNNIRVMKTDFPILVQLVMKVLECSERSAVDYATLLQYIAMRNTCLLWL